MEIDLFKEILLPLGINLTSSAINEVFRKLNEILQSNQEITKQDVEQILTSYLELKDVNVVADSLISFCAQKGYINIEETKIFAGKRIEMLAKNNNKITFGNNSVSETPYNKIFAGGVIEMQNAAIVQDEDGIKFFT